MTTAHERTSAVVDTRSFLQKLASDNSCANNCEIGEEAVRLLRYYPLDVDLDVSAAALPNLWGSPFRGITEAEHGRFVLLDDAEEGLTAALADEIQSEDEFRAEHTMPKNNQFDLAIALRTIRELAMTEGDLGYEYWHRIGKLLQRASSMQAEIDSLGAELERYRAIHAKTVRNGN